MRPFELSRREKQKGSYFSPYEDINTKVRMGIGKRRGIEGEAESFLIRKSEVQGSRGYNMRTNEHDSDDQRRP